MPMFAVYYVPPVDHPFYQIGSQILGYDIWNETLIQDNPIRAQYDVFDPEWAKIPQQFGVHATIGHTLYYEEGTLPRIEREIERLLNLFEPDKHFWLTPSRPYIYRNSPNITVLYDANQAFMMFHALVIACVHPLGTGHPLTEERAKGRLASLSDAQRHRTERFHHFGVLDEWHPHLGLLRPISSEYQSAVYQRTLELLPTPEPLTVDTICLLTRGDDETHFKIHRTFKRADYPQPTAFGLEVES